MRPLAIAALAVAFVLGNVPAVLSGEWMKVVGATIVLALMAGAARVGYHLGRASNQVVQAVREEVDEHRERAEVAPDRPQTYDLTVGWLTVGDPEATSASGTVHRSLTAFELDARLAEHGINRRADAIRGRHTLSRPAGLQVTWTPSTTDTTGETR